MNETAFSFDPDWMGTLTAPFMTNAFLAGLCIALAAGVMGYFTIARHSTFAAHALAHIGLPGATGAVLLGLPVSAGLGVFALGGALVIGALGKKASQREIATGTVLAFATGMGLFFARLSSSASQQMQSILFGSILTITDGQIVGFAVFDVLLLAVLAVIYRPLLFSSLDEQVAQAKGVPVNLMNICFMAIIRRDGRLHRDLFDLHLGWAVGFRHVPRSPKLHHRDDFHTVLDCRQNNRIGTPQIARISTDRFHQGVGDGCDALARAGESHAVGSGGRQRHFTADGMAQRLLRLVTTLADFRTIGHDDHACAHRPHAMRTQIRNRRAEHLVAVLAGTGGIGTDTEKHAYITQSGCGKQRVNQRMGCDITVRITFDAVTIPTQTGKP